MAAELVEQMDKTVVEVTVALMDAESVDSSDEKDWMLVAKRAV